MRRPFFRNDWDGVEPAKETTERALAKVVEQLPVGEMTLYHNTQDEAITVLSEAGTLEDRAPVQWPSVWPISITALSGCCFSSNWSVQPRRVRLSCRLGEESTE